MMKISGFQQLFSASSHSTRSFTLTAGDHVLGRVLKLFPKQTALLKLNGMTMVGKLEAPLIVRQNYWFQVTSTEGELPHLKMISPIKQGSELVESLVQELRIEVNKESKKWLSNLVEQGHALTKEKVNSLGNILAKESLTEQTKEILTYMLKLRLPLSKEVFDALKNVMGSSSFSKELQAIKEYNPNSGLGKVIDSIFFQSSGAQNEPFKKTFVNWLQATNHNEKAYQMLQHLNLFPKSKREEDVLSVASRLFTLQQSEVKAVFLAKVQESFREGFDMVRQLSQEVYEQAGEYEAFSNAWKAIDQYSNSEVIKQLMGVQRLTAFFHAFGLSQEGGGALLNLLASEVKSVDDAGIREKMELLISRITGFQLLSQANGPLSNFYMEVPLLVGKQWRDVSIQWSGQRQENQGVNPNYCHILFYVNLEALQDVVISVNIQNRIITLQIINQYADLLKESGEKFTKSLVKKLEELDYQLSGVSYRPLKQESSIEKKMSTSSYSYRGGVDFLI
ncbi:MULTISPECIES: hypothetical protein [Bacillaceae]|nr:MULTISPECIES: hypothetical protein [Bacillaceae]MBY6084810.1 hypothetical protein [Priestia flexa]